LEFSVIAVRVGIVLAAATAAVPLFGVQSDAPKNQFLVGKVVPTSDLKDKLKDPATHALVADDGKVYPLDAAGARMFAKDKRLLNRPMRLTARLDPKSGGLQVIYVHSLKNGKLHDVYYWCDICTIKGYVNDICDCCGDPMVLKEVEVK
jgi:hypothetical protein